MDAPIFDTAPLVDPFQRTIDYLRVSVTDRCDFRCVYCMSEHMTFLPKRDLLTLEELDRLCSSFVDLGVKKLRITGGEPLVRRNIMWFFERMGRHLESGRLDELTLTTNGSQLARHAQGLADAGSFSARSFSDMSIYSGSGAISRKTDRLIDTQITLAFSQFPGRKVFSVWQVTCSSA